MSWWKTKKQRQELDKFDKEILEQKAKKKELAMEVEAINLKLRNLETKHRMEMDDKEHSYKVETERRTAEFEREKTKWVHEKEQLIDDNSRDKKIFKEELESKAKIEKDEAMALLRLDSQQKIKQAEIDKDRAVQKVEAEADKKYNDQVLSLNQKYHNDLAEALKKFNTDGNATTKFMQDIALKMLEKAPAPRADMGLQITHNTNEEKPVQ